MGGRTGRHAAMVAAALMLGLVSVAGCAQDAGPSPSPAPTPAPLPVLGMPGTRSSPAGQYGWGGPAGMGGGMHKVVPDGAGGWREATAMMFATGPDCLGAAGGQGRQAPVLVAGLAGVLVESYEPVVPFGGSDPGEVTQAYALAVGGQTLCLFLTWNSMSTTEEELAPMLAILDTIRAQSEPGAGVRIVFTLDDGWDTG